jgi:hypothetical protein
VTPEEEQRRLLQLHRALEVSAAWAELIDTPPASWVEAGSELAADDAATDPFQLHSAAWTAISAGVDHLLCLRDSMLVQESPSHFTARLHRHGQPSLVRGALENSSRAVWLLGPDDRPTRVARRLRQEWSEVGELEKTRKLSGQPPRTDMDEHFKKLSKLARAAGVARGTAAENWDQADPAEIKHRPGYSEIVEDAAGRIGAAPNPKHAAAIWKACSSLAHGELRGVLAYLPKEVFDSDKPGMVFSHSSPNVDLIAAVTLMAVGTTGHAIELFRRRAGTWVGA